MILQIHTELYHHKELLHGSILEKVLFPCNQYSIKSDVTFASGDDHEQIITSKSKLFFFKTLQIQITYV